MPDKISDSERDTIYRSLRDLEARISRVEQRLDLAESSPETPPFPAAPKEPADADEPGLELRIGELGLAWGGSAVFLLGIVFLMTYTLNQGHTLLSALLGYAAGAGLFLLSRAWRKSLAHLAWILLSASLLLSYYTTLRLHYFTADPAVGSRVAGFALILIVAVLQLVFALRAGSQALAAMAVPLGLTTALLSDTPEVALPLVAVYAALTVWLALRRDWWRLLNWTVVLAYFTHILWLFNNPPAGHPVGAVAASRYPLAYLFLCASIFAFPALTFDRGSSVHAGKVAAVIFNCLGFSTVLGLALLALFPRNYDMVALAGSGLLLFWSVAQWQRTHIQFAPAAYACFGYLALSIAIYGYAQPPRSFLWLALQSFLVVSMALWFQSRTLVVVNAGIFLFILVAYWTSSPQSDAVNFGFALVALGSARVMNWQKRRLTLKTDGLRNVNLATAFVMVLYSLHHAVPGSFVALSWTATAAVYFLLSLLLKNTKYRWMSLFTLLATVLYLFFVDLARLEPKFRVAAFLFLGVLAVAISLFYTRMRRLKRKDD